MARIVIRIPDDELVRARARARREQTSLTALIRKHLRVYGGGHGGSAKSIREAMKRVLDASARYHGRIRGGRFDRSETYERGAESGG